MGRLHSRPGAEPLKHWSGVHISQRCVCPVRPASSHQAVIWPWGCCLLSQVCVLKVPAEPTRLLCPWDPPGKNTGVGCHSLLQGIFPTQGWNPGLPLCRQILYCLSHQGSPRIPEWVAYLFSRGSSDPGIKLGSPALQVDSLPAELSGKQ